MTELTELHGNEIATALIPTTVTLVTARGEEGIDRVATIAWVMPISHEPSLIAVAIRPGGLTSTAMASSGCFVVNVLPADGAQMAIVCGTKHGVDDRVTAAGLELSPARRVNASRVEQAVSWVECGLVEHRIYGDHELFIGRTLIAETRGRLDGQGKLIPERPLLMGQRGCFGHFEED